LTNRYAILAILAVQLICAIFFVGNILSSVLGFAPIDWQLSEYIELGAALGLILGLVLGGVALRRTQVRNARVEGQLRLASGAFMELLEDRFAEWELTPAERDVALFAIKGLSTPDIARIRDTSEGTVKAQTNAIYRKAGVSGRPQLLSLFIDDLMQGPVVQLPDASSRVPPAA
jgi:DNA-binding CsgD family transcriptional regulator